MTTPIKPIISLDDFMKVDLRVGTIISADDLENSNKLIKLVVDVGVEKMQVIAGIKKSYKVEDLVGKQIVMVVNLEPKGLAGYESQGMILAAGGEDGLPIVLFPEKVVTDGASIR